MLLAMLTGLAALQSCRTADSSKTKDVFTVTRSGKVLLFRGGEDTVTIRECPDMAALKAATGKEAIDAAVAQYCPKTDTNETTWRSAFLRQVILGRYENSYIPNGIPSDPGLKDIKTGVDQTAAQGTAAANTANADTKAAALKLRAEINDNIKATDTQMTTLQNYLNANPELLDDAAKAKLADLKKALESHQARLATVSDEVINKAAQDNLNNVESKRAKDWANAYAKFMDDKLLSPLFDSTKLVRLIETNPFEASLIEILTLLSKELPNSQFAKIPAGTFTMGSPASEADRQSYEGPQHQVTISKAFEMQTTEVTQSQWVSVMGSNPSRFQKSENCPGEFTTTNSIPMCPNNPVEQVSWDDAQAFISKLNAKADGYRYRYRLPTEAEWEYAARAGTTGAYAGDIDAMAWHESNSGSMSHPVAKKQANAWGLFDMHGNVWEWTADWWYGAYFDAQATDPVGPSSGSLRVARGGSWGYAARNCRSAVRFHNSPDGRGIILGFRLLRTSP